MTTKIYTLSLFLLLTQLCISQSTISGIIVSADNTSLPGANISISDSSGRSQGTIADADGKFSFVVLSAGTYQFRGSYLGYYDYTQDIIIDGGGDMDLGMITLLESEELLQTIEVVGRRRQDYNSDYSFSATKIAINNKELPQSVNTITKELIDDKVAFQLADAVKGVSSVTQVSFYNHFNIRGITQNEDGQIINGMRTRQFYFLQPLTQNIERVEVVKGPGSVTFSSADPGGTINMVTKKPLKETKRQVSFGTGSFSTMRAGLDFTGPLNKEKSLLYRLNAAVQEGKSFRDLVQNNAILVSPSISYIPNDKSAVNVEMIYSNGTGNLDRGQPVFSPINNATDLESSPISRNIAATNDYFQSREMIITTSLSHRFTDNIQLNVKYMKQTWNEDIKEHRANGFISDVEGNALPNLIRLRYAERRQFWDTDNLNAYLLVNGKIGNIENKLVIGYDFNSLNKAPGAGQNGARGYLSDDAGNTLTSDYNGTQILRPAVGLFDLENPSNIIRNTSGYNIGSFAIPTQLLTTNAVYIQNVTNIKNFTLLLSLRQEWFEDEYNYDRPNTTLSNNTALLPRVGLSYKLNDQFNIYGTYLTGFQPQVNTISLMPVIANNFFWGAESPSQFDPLESNLIELGVKSSLLNNRISASFAAYRIQQKNVLLQVPDEEAPGGFVFNQRGADRSQGFELDVTGFVSRNFQISGSYGYIDAIIEDDANPELIGQRKEATPQHTANLWVKYDIGQYAALSGVSFGLGLQYSGDKLGWYDRNLELPAYTVADFALYYRPTAQNLEFTLKINNILNEIYWTGAINNTRLFPGTPRNFMFITNYNF